MATTNSFSSSLAQNTSRDDIACANGLDIRIDEAALHANYTRIQKHLSKNTRMSAVVKADSYGMGMSECSRFFQENGCEIFFVASLDEGLSLRQHLPDCRIFVLHGLSGLQNVAQTEPYILHHLTPVLNTYDDLLLWHSAAQKHAQKLDCILHIDTGMHRLGLPQADWQEFCAQRDDFSGLNILYVMSHLACADDLNHPMTEQQYQKFMTLTAATPDLPRCLANSAGIFFDNKLHFDLVRPGAALYGVHFHDRQPQMSPVLHLDAPVLQTQPLTQGDSVGYGATYHADAKRICATLPLGYAHGYLYGFHNRGAVYLYGEKCPVIGRVSMDLITVDITKVADKVKCGDRAEILGAQQSVNDLAKMTDTTAYEILTGLGKIRPRTYQKA